MKLLCLCLLKAIVGITGQILPRVKSWTVGDFVITSLRILYSNSETLKEHKSHRISLFFKPLERIDPGLLTLMLNATKQIHNPVCNTSPTQRSSLLTIFLWIAVGRKIKLILFVCLFLFLLKIDIFRQYVLIILFFCLPFPFPPHLLSSQDLPPFCLSIEKAKHGKNKIY